MQPSLVFCRVCPEVLAAGAWAALYPAPTRVGPMLGTPGPLPLRACSTSTTTVLAALEPPPLLPRMQATANGTCSLLTGVNKCVLHHNSIAWVKMSAK